MTVNLRSSLITQEWRCTRLIIPTTLRRQATYQGRSLRYWLKLKRKGTCYWVRMRIHFSCLLLRDGSLIRSAHCSSNIWAHDWLAAMTIHSCSGRSKLSCMLKSSRWGNRGSLKSLFWSNWRRIVAIMCMNWRKWW